MVRLSTSSPLSVTSKRMKIVAAIPCLNTQRTISDVVAKTKKYVDEVIVIDDGSTDMTSQVAEIAGARVISHEKNFGKGAAMKTAFQKAEADIILFIDGDGQHDPSDIPELLAPLIQGKTDFVIGSRYLSESRISSNPFIRRTSNIIASFVISFIISVLQPISSFLISFPTSDKPKTNTPLYMVQLSDKPDQCAPNYRVVDGWFKWITDCTSGFTAMRKENYQMLNLISNGYQIETEMIFEQAKNGFVIAEIPIRCTWEGNVSKLSIVKDGFKTLLLLARKLVNYSPRNNLSES